MADFGAQIQINGTWTGVSLLNSDGIRITGGLQKNAQVADPLNCSLTLRNDDGALSARNPRSPNFGYLGPATPARAIVPDTTHLWLPDGSPTVTTPDHTSLDIVGDLDVRADIQPLHWERGNGIGIADKYVTTGNQRSWALWAGADGLLRMRWSTDGTFAAVITATSTAAVTPDGAGRIAVRATLDVNNGAGGWAVTFYTAPGGNLSGTWTQLGAAVTGTGVTSIFNSTASVGVGTTLAIVVDAFVGRVHALQIRNGIGGTVVANPQFTTATPGATSFVDSAGRTWTLAAGAELRAVDVRACGEVADWPVDWGISGKHKTAQIEFAGWLRRLNLPSEPLRSPLFREAVAADNVAKMVGYWPCEDETDARSIASGLSGGTAMAFTGQPSFAASDRIPGSAPLLGMAAGVTLTAVPSAHTATGAIALRLVADVPATGWAADSILAEMRVVSGSAVRWVLEMSNIGSLRIRGLDNDDAQVVTSGDVAFSVFGRRQMIGFQLTQEGADIHWEMFTRRIEADLSITQLGFDGFFTGRTVGRLNRARIAPNGNLDGGAIGHIMIGTSRTLAAGIDTAIVGNDGETAARRLIRLGTEFGIPIRIVGNPDDTVRMGPQQPGTKLELLTACAAADRGILAEARDAMVLEYRARTSIYNQTPRVTLAYGTAGESPVLKPDSPVENVCNDYTAERRNGSSYQATELTGRLSVLEFPSGVGPRPASATLDLEADEQLPAVAWWETHLGTWDDLRYPFIEVRVTRLVDAGKPALAQAVAAAGPGDRVVITNPPPDLPPQPIDVQVQGWEETIKARRRTIRWNTVPHAPWVVGVAGVDLVDSDGTTLVSGLSAVTPGTSQAVSVNVVGVPWSTSANVPFVMWLLHPTGARAERVVITAISGATSPQTMTITRGLDGYTRPHSAGAALVLFQPLRWAR